MPMLCRVRGHADAIPSRPVRAVADCGQCPIRGQVSVDHSTYQVLGQIKTVLTLVMSHIVLASPPSMTVRCGWIAGCISLSPQGHATLVALMWRA